jgi:hypothetical protein
MVVPAVKSMVVIVASLSLSALLSSCGLSIEGQTNSTREARKSGAIEPMDPVEARNEVRSLYTLTKSLVGTGWTEDSRSWWPCTTSGGEDGVDYSLFASRSAPLAYEPERVAEQVRAMWAEHGHEVEIVFDEKMASDRFILSDPPWLTGSSPDLPLVQFTVGTDYADFSATTRCVIGDAAELGRREVGLFDEDAKE